MLNEKITRDAEIGIDSWQNGSATPTNSVVPVVDVVDIAKVEASDTKVPHIGQIIHDALERTLGDEDNVGVFWVEVLVDMIG